MVSFVSNTVQVHVAFFERVSGVYKHLILKRNQHLKIYPGIWQVITGRIETSETALHAALRETKEETGISAYKIWVLPYVANFFNAKKNAVSSIPCFGIIADDDKIVLSGEHTDYQWLSIEECINTIVLPSHKEGSRIFQDFILNNSNNDIFKFNGM